MPKRVRKRLEKTINVDDLQTLLKHTLTLVKEMVDVKERLVEIEKTIQHSQKVRAERIKTFKMLLKNIGFPVIVGIIMYIIGRYF